MKNTIWFLLISIAFWVGGVSAMEGFVTEIRIGYGLDPDYPKGVVVVTDFNICETPGKIHLFETDPYFQETYSLLLSAFHSGKKIRLEGAGCNLGTGMHDDSEISILK